MAGTTHEARAVGGGDGAWQAALLGAEATVVTLQEELLLVESSEVTLGSLVKMQQLEVSQMRTAHHETVDEVVVKEHA